MQQSAWKRNFLIVATIVCIWVIAVLIRTAMRPTVMENGTSSPSAPLSPLAPLNPQASEPLPSPSPKARVASAPARTAARQNNSLQLAILKRDAEQLQAQMDALDPQNNNREITERQAQLATLQNQLTQYQQIGRDLNQKLSSSVQFQSVVQGQMIGDLEDRTRMQERIIASTQQQLDNLNLNPYVGSNEVANSLANQLVVQKQEMQMLTSQRAAISDQMMQVLTQLNNQTISEQSALNSAQMAIQGEMSYIQQDIARLNETRARSQELLRLYQQELTNVQAQITAMSASPSPSPSSSSPSAP